MNGNVFKCMSYEQSQEDSSYNVRYMYICAVNNLFPQI